MGVEKIKPDARIRHDNGEQLFPHALATAFLADIEMTDTPGARLLAERVAVQTAHADQFAVEKCPQQLFARCIKTVFTAQPVIF